LETQIASHARRVTSASNNTLYLSSPLKHNGLPPAQQFKHYASCPQGAHVSAFPLSLLAVFFVMKTLILAYLPSAREN
jgi:hypothetical protein